MQFSLGQRIRELRLKKGITQIDLSKDICTPSMISQIESDRARPSYKILFSIAQKLGVPLEKLLSDANLNLEYVSKYKMSQAMVVAKEYASAIPLLKELLETPHGQISTTDVLFDLGECYLQIGELDQAEKTFAQVQEIARLRKDYHLLALLLNSFALIECRRKHYQLAAYQWQKALEEAEKMEEPDIFLKATILFNLGHVKKTLGFITESITYYDLATELFTGSENPYDMAKVFLGLGNAYRKIGDLNLAAEYSEKATAMYGAAENALIVVKTQVHTAALYAQTGRQDEAIPMLKNGIKRLNELGNREEEAVATVELAKLKFQNSEADEAEELCQQARMMLPETHLYQAWINRLLGKIELMRHQRENAIKSFYKAADCFKQAEEVTEWDETMYEVAKLHLEENDLIRAYNILADIRQYTRQVLDVRGIVL